MALIQFVNVSKYYKKHWPVLEDINLSFEPGEFAMITGKSGAGKSTLLYHIYLKEMPTTGQVIVHDINTRSLRPRDIPKLRQKVGMIFQEFFLLHDRNVFENIALPLRIMGAPRGEIKIKALKILATTGLSHKMNEMPTYLSSGEKQRICIARAMVTDPMVLLADEPTGNLDSENAEEIFKLLRNVNRQGTAVIMATHNTSHFKNAPYRRIHIENGHLTK